LIIRNNTNNILSTSLSLAIGLLWHRCSVTYSSGSRDESLKVPTWSWASLIRAHESDRELNQLNHVTYDDVRDDIIQNPRFGVVNAHCTVSGTNPFREAFGGTIAIQGALIITKYCFPSGQVRPQLQFGTEKNDAHMDIWGPGEHAEVVDGAWRFVFCLG
jgi:hypothetical protein